MPANKADTPARIEFVSEDGHVPMLHMNTAWKHVTAGAIWVVNLHPCPRALEPWMMREMILMKGSGSGDSEKENPPAAVIRHGPALAPGHRGATGGAGAEKSSSEGLAWHFLLS